MKTAFSSLIIFQRLNYQHRVLLISVGAIEGLLKEKLRRKVTKGVLFLHKNAPAHWALTNQKKLAYLGFQYLYDPNYSPHFSPSYFYLFPGLKKQINGCHFWSERRL